MIGNRIWTDEEIGTVADTMNIPRVEALFMLPGRTLGAVDEQRGKIRRGLSSTRRSWTTDDDEYLLSMPIVTERVAAEWLGRSVSAVNSRRHRLRKSEGVAVKRELFVTGPIGRRTLLARTCYGCGLLLDASWFTRYRTKVSCGWGSRCVRCVAARVGNKAMRKRANGSRYRSSGSKFQSRARMQDLTRPRATRHGQPYIGKDFDVLANADLTILQKALILGRTYAGTQTALSKNGWASKTGLGDPANGTWFIDNPSVVAA